MRPYVQKRYFEVNRRPNLEMLLLMQHWLELDQIDDHIAHRLRAEIADGHDQLLKDLFSQLTLRKNAGPDSLIKIGK